MESVYKLSKYSQKISEACRSKQLDKVMEYNKHELAHINKLSKYFGNQKGGANVQEVVDAVGDLVRDVVADRNRLIDKLQQSVQKKDSVIAQIDDVIEERAISLSEVAGVVQTAPKPEDVLKKVQKLKEKGDELTKANEALQREKGASQGAASKDVDILAGVRASLENKVQELAQANQELDQARSQTEALQQSLTKVSSQASELSTKNDELVVQIRQLEHELTNAQAKADVQSQAIKELEEANTQLEVQARALAKVQQNSKKTSDAMVKLEGELKAAKAQIQTQADAQADAQAKHKQALAKAQEELIQAKTQLQTKDTEIAELEQAVADTKQLLEESNARIVAIINPKNP